MTEPVRQEPDRLTVPLFGWLAFVVAVLGVSILLAIAAQAEPDHALAVNEASFVRLDARGRAGPPERVRLPHLWPRSPARVDRAIYRFSLRLEAGEVRDWALLIPNFIERVTVSVNGVPITSSDDFQGRRLIAASLPAYAPLPPALLREGTNTFQVDLRAGLASAPFLDRIYLGDRRELLAAYHQRWLVGGLFPTVMMAWEAALAVILGLLWASRPKERAYGWFAVLLALAAARGTALVPAPDIDQWGARIWNLTVLWETLVVYLLARAVAEAPGRRWTWLLALPATAACVTFFVAPPLLARSIIVPIAVLSIVGFLSTSMWTLVTAAVRDRNPAALAMAIALGCMALFAFHDTLAFLNLLGPPVFMSRNAYSVMLLAGSVLLTLRFTAALNALDRVADVLRGRVAEAEESLRRSFEALRSRDRAAAIEAERVRLMRDLHDGVGGRLVSILALAERGETQPQAIVGQARDALNDMRLVIGSLEDYGGDLALALAGWLERIEPQLAAAGVALDWAGADLPIIQGLGPAEILDILRILQEAATNTMRHARASRLSLDVRLQDGGLTIELEDDGGGAPRPGRGGGLRNMRARAERLGGELSVERGEAGVRVVLALDPAALGAAAATA